MKIILSIFLMLSMFVSAVSRRGVRMRPLRATYSSKALHSTPPEGLSRHVRTMMIEGLCSWKGTASERDKAADKLTTMLLQSYATSGGEAKQANRALFEEAQLLNKACKNRAERVKESGTVKALVHDVLTGHLGPSSLMSDYHDYLAMNRAVYKNIVSRHEGIKASTVTSHWERESLEQYADAASAMGEKAWVKEANEWMWDFAVSFFRRNGARKELLRHLAKDRPEEEMAAWTRSLVRDLMRQRETTAEPVPIKLLDVGSCYNPLLQSPNAAAFDVTALDLQPAHPSVLQGDFLQVGIADPEPSLSGLHTGGEKGVVIDGEGRVKELIKGSFDAVSMSLVLSYLPTAAHRREMIRRARALLVDEHPACRARTKVGTLSHFSPPPDAHRSGLLLISEKQSIFNLPSSGLARGNNESLLQEWKAVISGEGFRLVKYRRFRSSDGRYSHLFAFRTVGGGEEQDGGGSGSSSSDSDSDRPKAAEMHIRQDFVSDGDSRLKQRRASSSTHNSVHIEVPRTVSACHSGDSASRAHKCRVAGRASVGLAAGQRVRTRLQSFLLPPVAIVGGGLGGTATAVLLRKAGIPCVVFEKDASFRSRRQGYALTMQQGASVLDGELGIPMETLLSEGTGVASLKHASYDKHGSLLGIYGATPEAAARAVTPRAAKRANKRRHNVHVPRQKLRDLLMRQLGEGTDSKGASDVNGRERVVQWGKELCGFTTKNKTLNVPLRLPLTRTGQGAGETIDYREEHVEVPWEVVELAFSDGSTFEASALVGADGMYSRVRALLEQGQGRHAATRGNEECPLRYLGLMVILGIAPLPATQRALSGVCTPEEVGAGEDQSQDLSRQQTQWLDGTIRVFSMPFGDGKHVMWQLSFPMDESAALALSSSAAHIEKQEKKHKIEKNGKHSLSSSERSVIGERLKHEALDRCEGWHDLLLSLLMSTAPGNISGHPVYDRDVGVPGGGHGLVTLLGDALHPMSPFKGQGANQALLDSVSLARSLRRSQVGFGDTIITHTGDAASSDMDLNDDEYGGERKGTARTSLDDGRAVAVTLAGQPLASSLCAFEAEMTHRARVKVLKSREAAESLHSKSAMSQGDITRAMAASLSKETQHRD